MHVHELIRGSFFVFALGKLTTGIKNDPSISQVMFKKIEFSITSEHQAEVHSTEPADKLGDGIDIGRKA